METSKRTTRSTQDETAVQACASCRSGKRKCDKSLPKCSLCSKKDIKCDYGNAKSDINKNSSASPNSLYSSNLDPGVQNSHYLDFAGLLFLDPGLLGHGQVELPGPSIVVPEHILYLTRNVDEFSLTASKYFNTIHGWMPIISKKRFYDHHLRPSFQHRVDLVLLFLCMKLITDFPPHPPLTPRTPRYQAAKHFYLDVENSGIISIQLLQAGVLLSLYELGHAIHPAAFLSVSACARYFQVLEGKSRTHPLYSKVLTWVEIEERKRIRWAIIVLDRLASDFLALLKLILSSFLSIGCPGRPFATEEPQLSDLLPTDDKAWDEGMITAEHSFTLASPLSSHMSKFGLLCQAARLLGQVLNHLSRDPQDRQSHDEEGALLERTLNAMINAAESEESPDFDQISFGYGALMTLHQARLLSNRDDLDLQARTHAQDALEYLLKRVITGLPEKLAIISQNLETLSPWGIFAVYRSCVISMCLSRTRGDLQSIEAVKLLKKALSILDPKWRCAGAYLQVLEAREILDIA